MLQDFLTPTDTVQSVPKTKQSLKSFIILPSHSFPSIKNGLALTWIMAALLSEEIRGLFPGSQVESGRVFKYLLVSSCSSYNKSALLSTFS